MHICTGNWGREGGGGGRGKESQAGSALLTQSPTQSLNSETIRSWHERKARVGGLTYWDIYWDSPSTVCIIKFPVACATQGNTLNPINIIRVASCFLSFLWVRGFATCFQPLFLRLEQPHQCNDFSPMTCMLKEMIHMWHFVSVPGLGLYGHLCVPLLTPWPQLTFPPNLPLGLFLYIWCILHITRHRSIFKNTFLRSYPVIV